MRYQLLACDYDGTLAQEGRVGTETVAALEELLATGRRLMLVTGRELDDLQSVFARTDLFVRIVAENGALLHCPATGLQKALAPQPPAEFLQALRERRVAPLAVGRVIVATWRPHEMVVREVIDMLRLDWRIIFNKDAVMALPAGVNKATGLEAALAELHLSPHEVVGVGDAENDEPFLRMCGCGVAVANALPAVQEKADLVTHGDHGAGVVELIRRLIANDLAGLGR